MYAALPMQELTLAMATRFSLEVHILRVAAPVVEPTPLMVETYMAQASLVALLQEHGICGAKLLSSV